MDKTINVFKLFEEYKSQELSFNDFQNIFDAHFDINNFRSEAFSEIFEDNYYKEPHDNEYLYAHQFSRLVKSAIEFSKNSDNGVISISKILPKNFSIRSITSEQYLNEKSKHCVNVEFYIQDLNEEERKSLAYKRLFHSTRKYLEDNETKERDFTPFLNMSDSDFQKIIDSKFLETDLVNHILKIRKGK